MPLLNILLSLFFLVRGFSSLVWGVLLACLLGERELGREQIDFRKGEKRASSFKARGEGGDFAQPTFPHSFPLPPPPSPWWRFRWLQSWGLGEEGDLQPQLLLLLLLLLDGWGGRGGEEEGGAVEQVSLLPSSGWVGCVCPRFPLPTSKLSE